MPELTCNDLGIPKRLRRNNREIVQDFSKDLYLYRWFKPDSDTFEGHISTAAVKTAFQPPFNISVNRSYYCEHSTDVMYNSKERPHLFDYGVMKTVVATVDGYTFQSVLPDKTSITVRFQIKHKPEICMYPHSEIIIYKNDTKIDKKITNKTLKADIREELRVLFTICHNPDPLLILPEEIKQQTILAKIKQLFKKLLEVLLYNENAKPIKFNYLSLQSIIYCRIIFLA